MAQVIAGLDAELLKPFRLGTPVETQAIQREVAGAGVEQPAAKNFTSAIGHSHGRNLDNCAGGIAHHLHPFQSCAPCRPAQWEHPRRRLQTGFALSSASGAQAIGQYLTLGIEYPQVS
ncbi:hypothetical protein D9M70_627240 [compost metagenome]